MKKYEMRFCPTCGTSHPVPVRKPSHVFHAVMSVVTFGAWIIVWLLAMLEASVARAGKCPKCGGKVK